MEKLMIITDIGSTTTKALLLKKENDNYTQLGLVHAPTSVEKPQEDVNIGIIKAIKLLEQQTGRSLFSENSQEFLLPGISYLCTSSAGGGLQILVIGLTTFDSAASAKRCAFGAGAVILDTFAVNDKRSAVQQMKAMAMLHPDIILMTGGTDGGAVAPVLRLAELIQFANPRAKFTDEPIPLIFAGNIEAQKLISGILAKRFTLHFVDNVRPDMSTENPGPARDLIHQLFMDYVMEQAPGYAEVVKKVDHDIIPTPKAVLNAIELLHENMDGDVIMVDIGGATTDVFSNLKGKFYRTVSANYGMSYSIANVLKDAGMDFVKHYLPPAADLDYVFDYLADKMLYPTSNPQDASLVYVEHIMARAALFLAREQHLEMNFNSARIGYLDRLTSHKNIENMVEKFYFVDEKNKEKFFLHDYKYAIGAGGVISHTQNANQALMLISDGLQTQGLTLIMRDKDFISPHLGKLSQIDPQAAAGLLLNNCLQELGWHIRPQAAKWKSGKQVLTLSYDNEQLEVLAGKRYFVPAAEHKRQFEIKLNKGFFLNDNATELSFESALPFYIDATFPEADNEIDIIRQQYKFAAEPVSLSDVFPLQVIHSPIEQGDFSRRVILPYLGDILVKPQDKVLPGMVVAQNLSDPPRLYIITLIEGAMPGLDKDNLAASLKVKVGDIVKIGQKIVQREKLSVKEQMYGYADHYCSPVRGIIENINYESGTLILHEVQDYSDKPVKVKISDRLGIKPAHLKGYLKVREGDFVYTGDLLAACRLDRANRMKAIMADKMSADKMADPVDRQADSAGYNSVLAPATGSITDINLKKGTITIHYDKNPLKHYAGISGVIEQVIPQREVSIKYTGCKIHGVVGFGRQAIGKLIFCPSIDLIVSPQEDSILVLKEQIDFAGLKKIAELGYKGLVAPSIHYRQLTQFTGEDIGVALTGNENIPFPIVITQGFGNFPLPEEYFKFFQQKHGSHIFIDGHTQIRAGVIRPQIIIQTL
ncbi:MAG: glutamate mutase L [Candidatus Cloacimonetes bacterium]|nr:glutamate mutase L [Candidatus Cloacimonadota bacterium]